AVTTLYKKTVTEGELYRLSQRREAANGFMLFAVRSGLPQAMNDLQQRVERARPDQEVPFGISQVVMAWKRRHDPQFRFQMLMQRPEKIIEEIQGNLKGLQLTAQLPGADKKPEQVKMLETLSAALGFEAWEWEAGRKGEREPMYFGGSRKLDDLLDFLVWKHQADRLGIELTEADVIREVNRAAGSQ